MAIEASVSSAGQPPVPGPAQRDYYYWLRSFVAGGSRNFLLDKVQDVVNELESLIISDI